jgi:hypothetical protein
VIFYRALRFRVPADVAIVVCPAVAVDSAWSCLQAELRETSRRHHREFT